jgi:hypothetical protein
MCVDAGRICTLPKGLAKEFREDVIGVHRHSDAPSHLAKDFRISPSCLKRSSPRRTCRENDVPARARGDRRRNPCRDVPGTQDRLPALLPLARAAPPVTDAELTAAYSANAFFDAHRDDPELGYRFLLDEGSRYR